MEKTNLPKRTCLACNQEIPPVDLLGYSIEWQVREFCSIHCFDSFVLIEDVLQSCSFCKAPVKDLMKIKFCVRFGTDIEQFCSSSCLSSYKAANSFCKLCHEKIMSFMLISGEEKFCSPFCVSRYNGKGINQIYFRNENSCHICDKTGIHHFEMLYESHSAFFCSKKCITQYRKEVPNLYLCALCGCLVLKPSEKYFMNGQLQTFCSKQCGNVFLRTEAEFHKCCECNVKKCSFDLVKVSNNSVSLYFCSPKCLMKGNIHKKLRETEAVAESCKSNPAGCLQDDVITPLILEEYPDMLGTVLNQGEEAMQRANRVINRLRSRVFEKKLHKSIDSSPAVTSQGVQTESLPSVENQKNTQTDDLLGVKGVPIPFPVYIPTPLPIPMLNPEPILIPVPVLFPLPVPVLTGKWTVDQRRKLHLWRHLLKKSFSAKEKANKVNNEERKLDNDKDENAKNEDKKEEEKCNPSAVKKGEDESSSPPDKNDQMSKSSSFSGGAGRATPVGLAKRQPIIIDEGKILQSVQILEDSYGLELWNKFVCSVRCDNFFMKALINKDKPFKDASNADRCAYLSAFVTDLIAAKQNHIGAIIYILMCIQKHLATNKMIDSIFISACFQKFKKVFYEFLQKFSDTFETQQSLLESLKSSPRVRIREEMLWEAFQLGSLSPSVLVFTLLYINTKMLKLKTVAAHENVSFKGFVKLYSTQTLSDGTPALSKILRYNSYVRQRKIYCEIREDLKTPMRCPVKINEFYASKCPREALLSGNFYFSPIHNCCPDSKIWFSSRRVPTSELQNMLHLVLMVEEVQQALQTECVLID